jgi:hypothetical protein
LDLNSRAEEPAVALCSLLSGAISRKEPGMFLPLAKRSRRHGARKGGLLKAKFKYKNRRRHRRLGRDV